jgi:hypothetical protein
VVRNPAVVNDSSSIEARRRYKVQRRGDAWVVCVDDRLLGMFASQSVATLTATALDNQQLPDGSRSPVQYDPIAAAASEDVLWPQPT